jgi:hypothetical protein
MFDNFGLLVIAVILLAWYPISKVWQRYVNDQNDKKQKCRAEYDALAILAQRINKHLLEMVDSQHKILELVQSHFLYTQEPGAPSDAEGEIATFLRMLHEMHADYMSDVSQYNARMKTSHFNDERYLPDRVYSTLPKAFKERLFSL